MPRYRIKVEGRDIEVATKNAPPLVGFFVTRIVGAASAEEAGASALASVAQDWSAGQFSGLGQTPALSVVETAEAGFLGSLAANTAYIFHRGKQ